MSEFRKSPIRVYPSEFTQFAIRIPSRGRLTPFSFKNRKYLIEIYDCNRNRILLKFSRQSEKSTMLGNKAIVHCATIPAFKVLYVSATSQQAHVFSAERLRDPIDISPRLHYLLDSKLSQNVQFKQFKNKSQIRIRYAFFTADRTRGIAADEIDIDEIQDILYDNIPVIEQCASHSSYKLFTYSGTPKSRDNTIEVLWTDYSTQNEWAIPCERHGLPNKPDTWHWNILGMKNIGKEGIVCAKCGQPIYATHPKAQWVSLQPVDENNKNKVIFEGFHVSQLMVPWINWNEDILMNRERYDAARFHNEVLGLSYDSGLRPLTQAQIKVCCKEEIHFSNVIENAYKCADGVSVGIDWGCHDDKTRILTGNGFKFFKDLTDEDVVAQFDQDTRKMSFVKPKVRTVRSWTEPLYHIVGKGIDMMLTGTHRLLTKLVNSEQWTVKTVEEFVNYGKRSCIRGYIEWDGVEVQTFILPGISSSPGYSGCAPLEIPCDIWLEFLGYALSEGGLCFGKSKLDGRPLPNCIKMSQRVVKGDANRAAKISVCLDYLKSAGIHISEFINEPTNDINWTIYGKQLWNWWLENVGEYGYTKRIPRQFLNLSKRQLKILFEAMMLGDGTRDTREGNENGCYSSTSLGLCEDFQELCIRLGYKSIVKLCRSAEGNRKTLYRVSWSKSRDLHLNDKALQRIERVPYSGKVYCCKVPSGFIVTERNGCIAYQGNSGESKSFTVLSLGGYMGSGFQIFYIHRFIGEDLEPRKQLDKICQLLVSVNFNIIGTDYGGGYDRNDHLMRNFGPTKLMKYQYAGNPKYKAKWEPALGRFILHRTEIMSDVFNAIKRRNILLPNWNEMNDPSTSPNSYASDMLNIFSEFSRQLRMVQYNRNPSRPDDTFHSILYCLMASMLIKPRPDIIIPLHENSVQFRPE
jgi:hypothetical protein